MPRRREGTPVHPVRRVAEGAPVTAARWLPYRRVAVVAEGGPRPSSPRPLRLFCFPHAGGAASAFRRWPGLLPPEVEVCAVQLPGRETRWREPVPETLPELVRQLADALDPLLDPGYALFGASFGGLVAYCLAHRLRETGRSAPVRLFVAATPPPDRIPTAATATAATPATAATAATPATAATAATAASAPPGPPADPAGAVAESTLAGVLARSPAGPTIRADPELARLAGRVLGHDVRLIRSYRHRAAPPLSCPITVFGGRDDPTVPAGELPAWAAHSAAGCAVRLLPGGHFVTQESAAEVTASIAADLT